MDKLDRIHTLHKLLRGRRTALPMSDIRDALECGDSTARRTIAALRDRYQAPLDFDRKAGGWRYDQHDGKHPFELPGLWFSDAELHALLAAHQLFAEIAPGLLQAEVAPLTERIQGILARRGLNPDQLARRVHLVPIGARPLQPQGFALIAQALLQRRRLRIRYRSRSRGDTDQRDISPQRLTWYRNNWYLDAWCHSADAFRRFACECIQAAEALEAEARACPEAELDAYFASAYGIFAGAAPHTAVLRFSPERARWVADEAWHPDQSGTLLPDGRYELRVPYGADRELLMDILRHGPEVEVLAPPELRQAAQDLLARTLARYADT